MCRMLAVGSTSLSGEQDNLIAQVMYWKTHKEQIIPWAFKLTKL